MMFLRRIKLGVQGMMAKRQRRRQRVKGTAWPGFGQNWQTDAQRLVDSYTSGRFATAPVPTGAGVKRAAQRLKEHRKKFAGIPKPTGKSRQVLRREARKASGEPHSVGFTRYFGAAA
jgi:hypothetical protein